MGNSAVEVDLEQMLDAHVQFELSQLTGEALTDYLATEAVAWMDWLSRVKLADVVDPIAASELAVRALREAEIPQDLTKLLGGVLQSAHAVATDDETMLGDLIPAATYDAVAQTVIGLTALRQEITMQITTSEVYSRLMAHVMYQGIKNYLQTESVIARKVPGASTLMRMSQSALSSAAPKLEATIDKQLTAFVNANIADTIRESNQYLDKVLDSKVLTAVADELWDTNAKTPVSEFASLVPVAAVAEFATAGADAWRSVRDTPFVAAMLTKIVTDFVQANGERKLSDLLAAAGVGNESVSQLLSEFLAPMLAQLDTDGFLEQRIRARLKPFYAEYFPQTRAC